MSVFSFLLQIVLGKLNYKLYKATVIERPKLYFRWLDRQNMLSKLLGRVFVWFSWLIIEHFFDLHRKDRESLYFFFAYKKSPWNQTKTLRTAKYRVSGQYHRDRNG